MTPTTDLRYPIGKFHREENLSESRRREMIAFIAETPQKLREAVQNLTNEQLNTPYRPGGWTVKQLVHHVADSHMNAYCRFKLTLTEEKPTIKPYEEGLWAELNDTRETAIEVSLTLLEALHIRWVSLLQSMSDADFKRLLVHPQSGEQPLERMLGLYAWHGPHHVAHVTALRERMGW